MEVQGNQANSKLKYLLIKNKEGLEKLINQCKQRLKQPYLKREREYYDKIDKRKKRDYEGVNLTNGEILQIKSLDKIGTNREGTYYLYSAYISSTFSEEEQAKSYYVCFELPDTVENIIQEEMTKERMFQGENTEILLQLLSQPTNFTSIDELKYIGRIEQHKKINHSSEPQNYAIKKVQEMQENYTKEQKER